MICCFMNFHEQESANDLIKHLDREIDIAIGRGCSQFLTGMRYPEDEIFAQRVQNAAKFHKEGEINLITVNDCTDEELRRRFISLANWEIYAYDIDKYPLATL